MDIQGVTAAGSPTQVQDRMQDEIGKDAFLKLLVTQLQHQDPLNPMENSEFVAQLAQFSSLEGINNLGTSMDGVAKSMSSLQNFGAASLIGRSVKVQSDEVEYGGGPVKFGYSIEKEAQDVSVLISDINGAPVRSLELGSTASGYHEVTWDGRDFNGMTPPPGIYRFTVTAKDADKSNLVTTPYSTATVEGINYDNGKAMLMVGGLKVPADEVKEIH